jgi:RNA polymerase sigma-70 factor (ECF subfamily)
MTPSLATFEDNALIKMALAGQTECFTVLMDRHLFIVKRTIRSMVRNATDADDLVQEVLLKVWRNLSTFRSEASFRTWITRVAINEALQLFRRQRYHSRCQAAYNLDAFASFWDTPHQHLDRTETTQTVRKAMARLPEKYRRVLVLREFEQLSLLETAESLQTSVPAVKSRLFRARALLKASLRLSRREARAA